MSLAIEAIIETARTYCQLIESEQNDIAWDTTDVARFNERCAVSHHQRGGQ